jgi:hypothetical protein
MPSARTALNRTPEGFIHEAADQFRFCTASANTRRWLMKRFAELSNDEIGKRMELDAQTKKLLHSHKLSAGGTLCAGLK